MVSHFQIICLRWPIILQKDLLGKQSEHLPFYSGYAPVVQIVQSVLLMQQNQKFKDNPENKVPIKMIVVPHLQVIVMSTNTTNISKNTKHSNLVLPHLGFRTNCNTINQI